MIRPSIRSRWILGVVAATAMAVAGQVQAVPVSTSLNYTCTYPLIGAQPLTAQINSDIPASINVGTPTPQFQIDAVATAKGNTWSGLNLVGATSVEGTASATSTLTGNNLNLDLTVPLTIPNQTVPATSGDFSLNASGSAPSVTFDASNTGDVNIAVGDINLNLIARDSSGNPVQFPNSDPNTGEFPVPCTLDSGQNNVLTTIAVQNPQTNPASISVSPQQLDFGTVQGGMNQTSSVTVSNTGGEALGINSIALSGANAGAFSQTNNCTSVNPGSSCQVNVTFYATGNANFSASLDINSTDPNNATVSVPITGTSAVAPPPNISADKSSVDFGSILPGNSANDSVTITNNGGQPLDITGIGIGGTNAGDFMQTNNCSQLAVNATCTVQLTFTPSTTGARSGMLNINSNDPDTPTLGIPLSGQGQSQSTGVELNLDLAGSTKLRYIRRPVPLKGTIDANLDLSTGMFKADMALDPTKASLGLSWANLSADIAFEPAGKATGTYNAGALSADTKMYIKLPKIYLNFFGFKIPIGGGSQCRTMDPADIQLNNPQDQPFDLQNGGPVAGTYTIPPVSNCGGVEGLINPIMAVSGNKIYVTLTPQ